MVANWPLESRLIVQDSTPVSAWPSVSQALRRCDSRAIPRAWMASGPVIVGPQSGAPAARLASRLAALLGQPAAQPPVQPDVRADFDKVRRDDLRHVSQPRHGPAFAARHVG